MAMRMGDGRGGPVSEINVTPLVAPLERRPGRVVYLKADAGASYSTVMAVMDRLREARVDDVGLITRTPPVAGEPLRGEL